MRNIFLEKALTKCGGEASPRPFYKKNQNCASLYINSLNRYTVRLCPKGCLPKYIKTKMLTNYLDLK